MLFIGAMHRKDWAIAIHGGALVTTFVTPKRENVKIITKGMEHALQIGIRLLEKNQSALDAVEAVVRYLEDSPHFNAGKGSAFNQDGKITTEAAIMDGSNIAVGAITGARTIKNPISLARKLMEHADSMKEGDNPVFLSGKGVERFADWLGEDVIERVDQDYFKSRKILQEATMGTVGAVALDSFGNLAAATSTGGTSAKRVGRIGDSPVIGAGTYADNETCAVSTTGVGESFIRRCVAYDVTARIKYGGVSLKEAARATLRELPEGHGGFIALDFKGDIAMPFNSLGMYHAAADSDDLYVVGLYRGRARGSKTHKDKTLAIGYRPLTGKIRNTLPPVLETWLEDSATTQRNK